MSHQLTEDQLTDTNAKRIFETNLTLLHVEINNGMWPFTSECYVEKDKDKRFIVLVRNQVNHNSVSQNLANEITNNFLGNPITADLTGKNT